MIPARLDPTQYTALHSLDLGNFLSMDGRAHPLDALQPAALVEVPATIVPPGTQTGPVVPQVGMPGDGSQPGVADMHPAGIASAVAGALLPPHFGARLAIGVIATVVILIAIARLIL